MALIIDGYNLLHATGITGRSGTLQGSREALLRFLAASLDPAVRSQTTVVFDAAEAPPGLPRTVIFETMTVHYASSYDDADELIEELIAKDNVPRSLLVISSDHRIQRAAQRRRAKFIDSDVWFADMDRSRRQGRRPPPTLALKPQGALSSDEINYWLAEFAERPSFESPSNRPHKHTRSSDGGASDLRNPFPPGYGEDLLEGQ
jgi:predicted RNA-binding protein with PIN domain